MPRTYWDGKRETTNKKIYGDAIRCDCIVIISFLSEWHTTLSLLSK